ncbi:MAG: hypothetical protein AAFX45_03320 [Pseudomonadota bacterium]
MESIEIRRGGVLVFTWDGSADKPAVLAALGAGVTDAAEIEVFAAEQIAPLGLTAYLAEGHGIDAGDLAGETARLDGLIGTLVVVSARAFQTVPMDIAPGPGLTFVAQLTEGAAPVTAPKPIETESAKGNLSGAPVKPPKSDARIGGMVAMAVLLFLALFVVFFVLAAG